MPGTAQFGGGGGLRRATLLQYQAVVAPFVIDHPIETNRPGLPLGGSIVYRPTLLQYQALTGPGLVPGVVVGTAGRPGVVSGGSIVYRPTLTQYTALFGPLRVSSIPVPDLSWKGWYPNLLLRLPLNPEGRSVATFSAALPFQDPSRFGWRPVAPDRLDRRLFHPGAQRFLALETPVQYPIPETSWNPILPAWLRAARPLTVRTAFTQNLDPLPNAPSPALAWKGWQPDRLDRSRRVPSYPAFTAPPRVISFVPPLVGGLASYPDQLYRKILSVGSQRVWADRFDIVIPDLRRDWSSHYPSLLFRRPTRGGVAGGSSWSPVGNPSQLPTDWRRVGPHQRLSRPRLSAVDAGSVPLPPSIDVFTGELLSWDPGLIYYPTRRLGIMSWTRIGTLNPEVPGGGIPCVEIVQFVATRPCLRQTHATQSRLCYLAATQTKGTDLDWC